MHSSQELSTHMISVVARLGKGQQIGVILVETIASTQIVLTPMFVKRLGIQIWQVIGWTQKDGKRECLPERVEQEIRGVPQQYRVVADYGDEQVIIIHK